MEIGHGILSLGAIVFRLGAIETLSSSVRICISSTTSSTMMRIVWRRNLNFWCSWSSLKVSKGLVRSLNILFLGKRFSVGHAEPPPLPWHQCVFLAWCVKNRSWFNFYAYAHGRGHGHMDGWQRFLYLHNFSRRRTRRRNTHTQHGYMDGRPYNAFNDVG